VEIRDTYKERGISRVLNYHSPGNLYNKADVFPPSAAPSPAKQSKAHAKEHGNYFDWPSKAMGEPEIIMDDPTQSEVEDGDRFLDLFQNRLQSVSSKKDRRKRERMEERKAERKALRNAAVEASTKIETTATEHKRERIAARKAERKAFKNAAIAASTRIVNTDTDTNAYAKLEERIASKKAAKIASKAAIEAALEASRKAVAKFERLEKQSDAKKAATEAAMTLIAEEEAKSFWLQLPSSDSPAQSTQSASDSLAEGVEPEISTRKRAASIKIRNAKAAAMALIAEEEAKSLWPQLPSSDSPAQSSQSASDSLAEGVKPEISTRKRAASINIRNRRVVHDTDDDDDTTQDRKELVVNLNPSTPDAHSFVTLTFPPIPYSSSPSPRTSLMSPDSPAFSPPSILSRRKPLSGKSKAKRLDFETAALTSVLLQSPVSAMLEIFDDEAEVSPTKKPRNTLRAKKVTPKAKPKVVPMRNAFDGVASAHESLMSESVTPEIFDDDAKPFPAKNTRQTLRTKNVTPKATAKRVALVRTAAVTRLGASTRRAVSSKLPVSVPVVSLPKTVPEYELEESDDPEIIDLTMLNTSDDEDEEVEMVEIKMEV